MKETAYILRAILKFRGSLMNLHKNSPNEQKDLFNN